MTRLGQVVVLLLTAWATCAWGMAGSTRQEIQEDFDSLPVSDAGHTFTILDAYRRAMPENLLAYAEIVRQNREAPDAAFALVLFAAINHDSSLWKALLEAKGLTPELQDAKIFYEYKLNHNASEQLRALNMKYRALTEHSVDSHLILFLPFTDDPMWALSQIERIAEKADGAAAEMLSWAFEVFCAVNKDNQDVHRVAAASPLVKRYGWRCD